MHSQFILFHRAGIYFCEDTATGKQTSLRTRGEKETSNLLHANARPPPPVLTLKIARTHMRNTCLTILLFLRSRHSCSNKVSRCQFWKWLAHVVKLPAKYGGNIGYYIRPAERGYG
jgi:hypothetical protein